MARAARPPAPAIPRACASFRRSSAPDSAEEPLSAQTIVSPEDQSVTFVELFFDLVFVFSVTQIVGLLHGLHGWTAVGQAVLVFWLVWWAWTQFTWALNAADTTHHLIELGTLVATAVAFFMAVAVPYAFQGRAVWFAVPYVLVRVIGLTLYAWVASSNPRQHFAVRMFSAVSASGLAAVLLGAFLGGSMQYVAWGVAIVLDVVAASIGGRLEGWDLHPRHFAERHGLFVIIALGETLIVAAGGLTANAWSAGLILVAVMAVVVSCTLWWSHFVRAKPWLDHAIESSTGATQTQMARDVFSLLHFPMLCGVIGYAVAIEEAISHPDLPLSLASRGALAAGLLLFVGGMALATRRACGIWLAPRLLLTAATALAVLLVPGRAPWLSLVVAFAGVALIAVLEQRRDVPAVHAPH